MGRWRNTARRGGERRQRRGIKGRGRLQMDTEVWAGAWGTQGWVETLLQTLLLGLHPPVTHTEPPRQRGWTHMEMWGQSPITPPMPPASHRLSAPHYREPKAPPPKGCPPPREDREKAPVPLPPPWLHPRHHHRLLPFQTSLTPPKVTPLRPAAAEDRRGWGAQRAPRGEHTAPLYHPYRSHTHSGMCCSSPACPTALCAHPSPT